MNKRYLLVIAGVLFTILSYAQIGYQVSLLNSATGEPRANETVSVEISITNSQNEQIYSGTQSATTNDFGVLSLQVGNANTFKDVDWSKLPLFISATVDGVMVGKSQILNVPVAEVAKELVSVPLDSVCKSWSGTINRMSENGYSCSLSLTLTKNKTGHMQYTISFEGSGRTIQWSIPSFSIIGDVVFLCCKNNTAFSTTIPAYYHNGSLYISIDSFEYKELSDGFVLH